MNIHKTLAYTTALVCAGLFASSVYSAFVDERPLLPPRAAQSVAPVAQPQARQVVAPVAAIPSWHLFGSKPVPRASAPAAAAKQTTVKKETRLKLELKGIVDADAPGDGWAIIRNQQSGEEKHFGIGDKLFDLAELSEVHADHIVLSRKGVQEILRLPDEPLPLGLANGPINAGHVPFRGKINRPPAQKFPPGTDIHAKRRARQLLREQFEDH